MVVVALPIAALVWESKHEGWSGFWAAVSGREAVAALELTLAVAALAAFANAVLGTVIAWVLVRDEFRGKALVNAVIDLPFALPTIVAGLVLLALLRAELARRLHLAFTRAARLPRAALRDAAVRRAHGAAGAASSSTARWRTPPRSLGAGPATVFRRIVLPSILPGILSGVTMAFARAVGEIGAVVLITGNLPFRTEVASVYIFNQIESTNPSRRRRGVGRPARDLASRCCSRSAGSGGCATRHERARAGRYALRFVAIGYLAADPRRPARARLLPDDRRPRLAGLACADEPVHGRTRFELTLKATAIAVPLNTVFGIAVRARDRAAALPREGPRERLRRPAARALAGRRRVLALPALRRAAAGSAASSRTTASRCCSRCPRSCSRRCSSRCRSSRARSCRRCARSATSRSRRRTRSAPPAWQTFWRITLPSIRWAVVYGVVLTTARCLGEYGAVAIVGGNIEGRTQTATLAVAGCLHELRPSPAPTRSRSCSRRSRSSCSCS